MVRKKRMTGIAARMIVINLYMASLPKSFFGRPIPRGAGSRWIAYHYADKIAAKAQSLLATTSRQRIHTRSCASRQGALEVAAAHMAPATWLPMWSVRWDRGPTARELAMCRPLTRGILKRYGTRITSSATNLMRCHFIDDRTGLAISAASSLVFGRRIAEQSSALRSPSMC